MGDRSFHLLAHLSETCYCFLSLEEAVCCISEWISALDWALFGGATIAPQLHADSLEIVCLLYFFAFLLYSEVSRIAFSGAYSLEGCIGFKLEALFKRGSFGHFAAVNASGDQIK